MTEFQQNIDLHAWQKLQRKYNKYAKYFIFLYYVHSVELFTVTFLTNA